MERQVAEQGFKSGKEKQHQTGKSQANKNVKEKQNIQKKEEPKPIENNIEEKKQEVKTEKTDKAEKKEIKKPEVKIKRNVATVKGKDLPISTKTAGAICRFIKFKNPEEAIKQLEKVEIKQLVIPFRGETPHRKGLRGGYSRGRYPIKTAQYFIKLLKSLNSNIKNNNMDEAIVKITIAKADIASRPTKPTRMAFGRKKFKRTHVYIEARELPNNKIKQTIKEKQKK